MNEYIVIEMDGSRYAGTITAHSPWAAAEFLVDELIEAGHINPTEDLYLIEEDPCSYHIFVAVFINNELAYTLTLKKDYA